MPNFKGLLPWQKNRHIPHPLVSIQPELLEEVKKVAAQDGVTVAKAVNDFIAFALAERRVSNVVLNTWEQLTDREKEIAGLTWSGMTNTEIAEQLVISPNTVKTHIRNIFTKFNVSSKDELRTELSALSLDRWVDTLLAQYVSPTNSASPDGVSPESHP